jgi:hypothetical protein
LPLIDLIEQHLDLFPRYWVQRWPEWIVHRSLDLGAKMGYSEGYPAASPNRPGLAPGFSFPEKD